MQMPEAQPEMGVHRILIVDDDEFSVRAMERVMRHHGFDDVRCVTDATEVQAAVQEFEPDLILLDLHMPGTDGLAVMRQIEPIIPADQFLPIIMVSGDAAPAVKQQALAMGAADFISKPFEPLEIGLRVRNLLRMRELTNDLEAQVEERTTRLRAAEVDMATRLAVVSEYRDYPDGAHVQRVGRTAALLATALQLSETDIGLIRFAAPLHDIGKIAIPDHILLKPAPLTLEELDVMKSHTVVGAEMLEGSQSAILRMAGAIARYHHENWDGTGYSPGVRGEQIPLPARIAAVADVFDALTHDRPYKKAWPIEQAVEWMQSMRGRKFDPDVIDALMTSLDAIKEDPLLDISDAEAAPALPIYMESEA